MLKKLNLKIFASGYKHISKELQNIAKFIPVVAETQQGTLYFVCDAVGNKGHIIIYN